jgi:hypothetical protein
MGSLARSVLGVPSRRGSALAGAPASDVRVCRRSAQTIVPTIRLMMKTCTVDSPNDT